MKYAGIGSRKARRFPVVMQTCSVLAGALADLGYTLRSGAADGCDRAFELTAGTDKEIFLPWAGFNGSDSTLFETDPRAYLIAAEHHPKWRTLDSTAKSFHARNSHQILGLTLDDPVDFVVCWTPDGGATGGTGQALRLAQALDIPIYNIFWPDQLAELWRLIASMRADDGEGHW